MIEQVLSKDLMVLEEAFVSLIESDPQNELFQREDEIQKFVTFMNKFLYQHDSLSPEEYLK